MLDRRDRGGGGDDEGGSSEDRDDHERASHDWPATDVQRQQQQPPAGEGDDAPARGRHGDARDQEHESEPVCGGAHRLAPVERDQDLAARQRRCHRHVARVDSVVGEEGVGQAGVERRSRRSRRSRPFVGTPKITTITAEPVKMSIMRRDASRRSRSTVNATNRIAIAPSQSTRLRARRFDCGRRSRR